MHTQIAELSCPGSCYVKNLSTVDLLCNDSRRKDNNVVRHVESDRFPSICRMVTMSLLTLLRDFGVAELSSKRVSPWLLVRCVVKYE
jgi:hypothetical protein